MAEEQKNKYGYGHDDEEEGEEEINYINEYEPEQNVVDHLLKPHWFEGIEGTADESLNKFFFMGDRYVLDEVSIKFSLDEIKHLNSIGYCIGHNITWGGDITSDDACDWIVWDWANS